jgi:hypothetical protein
VSGIDVHRLWLENENTETLSRFGNEREETRYIVTSSSFSFFHTATILPTYIDFSFRIVRYWL